MLKVEIFFRYLVKIVILLKKLYIIQYQNL